jgi:hypothetical protein
LWNIPEKSSKHSHSSLPVESPFPETTCFMFCPIFCTPSSCAPIASTIDWCWSSWKIRYATCQFHFQIFYISTRFFVAKILIYPSKQFDMIHVLSLTSVIYLSRGLAKQTTHHVKINL